VYQWASSALTILPQCVLLGMTFPLLSAAYLRLAPDMPGEVLGGLYFSNSIGAAIGALAASFLLLPAVGMPGSMFTAGLLNVVVALGAWAVWKAAPRSDAPAGIPAREAAAAVDEPDVSRLTRIVLVAAFITGATSFIYEIGWVRLLNLVLGTTVHSFELMLAAFILGLACGGYWIRWRAPAVRDAIRYAAIAQVLMGVAALASVIVFSKASLGMEWLLQALARSDQGYTLFNTGSAMAALAVMFPAAFFAGMTLPLFTLALLRKGGGEKQIGRVYASNTLGAIVGVFVMVHLLVPLLGVRLAVVLSAMIDAGLGLYLLLRVSPRRVDSGFWAATGATAVAFVASMVLGRLDPHMMASGVYRYGHAKLDVSTQVQYLRDGKTATVSFSLYPDGVANIATNGKPDAGLPPSPDAPPTPDEYTMAMAGALPLLLHPAPRDVAVIGWGSGLTTHTLLGSKRPRNVDTIEIEKAMHEGARLFGERNRRAYEDPRSRVRFDDARTWFSTRRAKYDVIVSEPSNPWVSGVSSLFTEQFYKFLRGHLNDDGMLFQWIHCYELNDALLGTMVAALLKEFPNSDVYVTNTSDLILVAYAGKRTAPDFSVLGEEPLKGELQRLGLDTPEEFALRKVGGPGMLATYVRLTGAQPYSDFYPTVSLHAPRSRYKGEAALSLLDVVDRGVPVAGILEGRVEPPAGSVKAAVGSRYSNGKIAASAMRDTLIGGGMDARGYGNDASLMLLTGSLMRHSSRPIADDELLIWTSTVAGVVRNTLSQLPPEQLTGVWVDPKWISREGQPDAVLKVLDALDAAARRDGARMLPTAVAVLEIPGDGINYSLREQMLLFAHLGAISQGQPQVVEQLEERFGGKLPSSPELKDLRVFVRTWAQRVMAQPAAG
jgi:spermidine synthase